MSSGQFPYGWARLNVKARVSSGIKALLTGYAYKSIPNKSIVTGRTNGPDVVLDPATLGHLAQGASAIKVRRADKSR